MNSSFWRLLAFFQYLSKSFNILLRLSQWPTVGCCRFHRKQNRYPLIRQSSLWSPRCCRNPRYGIPETAAFSANGEPCKPPTSLQQTFPVSKKMHTNYLPLTCPSCCVCCCGLKHLQANWFCILGSARSPRVSASTKHRLEHQLRTISTCTSLICAQNQRLEYNRTFGHPHMCTRADMKFAALANGAAWAVRLKKVESPDLGCRILYFLCLLLVSPVLKKTQKHRA